MRKALVQGLALAVAVTAWVPSMASELAAGGSLRAFSLDDQRDQPHQVDEQTRLLLFTRDKDAAKMAFGVLGQKSPDFLAKHEASFVLDISEMPRLITWAIAKPRMRRHDFPLLLDAGPTASKELPAKEGELTLVFLNKLKVEQVKFVGDAPTLEKELAALAN